MQSDCSFRINTHTPQLWNAVTGEVRENLNFMVTGKRLVIPIKFESFQSWFVVFLKNTTIGKPSTAKNFPDFKEVAEIAGPWKVAFDTKWGGPADVEFPSLTDWSKHLDERVKFYSGKAAYTKTFDFNNEVTSPLYLSLGTVKNIAEVTLNGKKLGIVWTAPWSVNVSSAIQKGRNTLEIEVINLWPNRLIKDAALPVEQRLTNTNIPFKKDAPLLPSGLLGPVVLKAAE